MSAAWALLLLVCAVAPWSETAAGEPSTDYTMIQRAFLREDFQAVTSLAPAFFERDPEAQELPRVWIWLALSLDRLQRSNEALKQLDLLKIRLEPGAPLWPEVIFWEGEISRLSHQTLRAKLAYRRLLDRFPNSSWASQGQLGLGMIALQEQAFDVAAQHVHEVALRQAGTPVALQALLLEGFCDLRLQRFQEAVTVLEPLMGQLKEPHALTQAAFYLGESLSGLGRYREAARAYHQAIDSPQWRHPALFGLGWADYKVGRCEESVEAFERYLSEGEATGHGPSLPSADANHRTEALFAQGSCLMQLGKEEEALQRFQEVVSGDPRHALALESGLTIADAYQKQGEWILARELLHALLQHHPDPLSRAQIQLPLGAVALAEGDAARAKAAFGLAAQSDQPSLRQAALNGLGDIEMFLGHLVAAQRFYEEALRVADGTSAALYATYQLGHVQLQLGAFDEAAGIFTRLSAAGDSAFADDARLALVITYLSQHREDAARALLDAVRETRPADGVVAGRAAYYEALLALSEDHARKARQLCEEAMAKAPGSDEAFEARLLLADLEVEAGERPEREVVDALERLYASDQLPRHLRARLAKRLGDLARDEHAGSRAITWYEETARLLPSMSGEIAYRIASCHEELGDLDEAARWYEGIEEPPWRVRGLLAAAKVLERQGRAAEAEAIYERLAREPIPEAQAVQERLAVLREESLGTR
ncbi:MAG: tetratricopeptide repeat protein [Candidatus Omnitrophica bacterium]|nr:tetratricopeptide repeat protein [Candidatus Omnitrophota bacterium]MBI3083099.1 tetratricopeptide repeat protein [Candidatus Omnitrophota bacterium]